MALVSVHGVVIESFRTVEVHVELLSVRPAKACKGLEAHVFLLHVRSTLHLSVHNGYSGSVSPSVGHSEYQDFRQHQHVRPSAATGNSFGGSGSS